jgi:glycosyltransferase involved in cell wall biosynthesis
MQLVNNPLITLDVYSSTEVYGKDFYEKNDHNYTQLYEQAKQLPNVNYLGYRPNSYITENIHKYNMYVYPSIFEETFCISLLEAMAGGLYCITTNLGAIFETGAEFPMYIPFDDDYKRLASKFGYGIQAAANTLHEPQIHNHIESQSHYANIYYNWSKIGSAWTRFLQGAINAKK